MLIDLADSDPGDGIVLVRNNIALMSISYGADLRPYQQTRPLQTGSLSRASYHMSITEQAKCN
jgi:hypothetical protein